MNRTSNTKCIFCFTPLYIKLLIIHVVMQDRLSFKQQNLSVGQHFSIAGHQAKTIHQLLERVQASLSINVIFFLLNMYSILNALAVMSKD